MNSCAVFFWNFIALTISAEGCAGTNFADDAVHSERGLVNSNKCNAITTHRKYVLGGPNVAGFNRPKTKHRILKQKRCKFGPQVNICIWLHVCFSTSLFTAVAVVFTPCLSVSSSLKYSKIEPTLHEKNIWRKSHRSIAWTRGWKHRTVENCELNEGKNSAGPFCSVPVISFKHPQVNSVVQKCRLICILQSFLCNATSPRSTWLAQLLGLCKENQTNWDPGRKSLILTKNKTSFLSDHQGQLFVTWNSCNLDGHQSISIGLTHFEMQCMS